MNAVISHPEMHQIGLNASIVETVSATFSQGQVTKGVVVGEMALQHKAGDGTSSSPSESIRLENFAVLEKVAANPTFITQNPAASGEYIVNCLKIARPGVAFKYRVHLDDSNHGAHAPISLTPNWKIESTQASVILSYHLNPSFLGASRKKVLLKNVIIFVSIEGAKANSCLSKPAGIFAKDKSLIYWKLADLTLEDTPQKLLARFSTEGEAKAGGAEAKWEMMDEQAVGLGSGLSISQGSNGKDDKGCNDPFADEDTGTLGTTWKSVPLTRRIVSERYLAS